VKPSAVTSAYWVSAASPNTFYSSEHSGKWCIFCTAVDVDDLWAKVSYLAAKGMIAYAKASTALGHKPDDETHVICAYTLDYRNTEELMRTRAVLRTAGITQPLRYKRDIDSLRPPEDPELEFYYVEF
jgi:hypothetical protein